MAGNRRSSTLCTLCGPHLCRLGMAGNRRSSTLEYLALTFQIGLGMAGNRRSSTLNRWDLLDVASAGDGRESPLKYTWYRKEGAVMAGWGWPGIAAQVHYMVCSPYVVARLGMAGNRRSSTLQPTKTKRRV